jgi:hypothetical protein
MVSSDMAPAKERPTDEHPINIPESREPSEKQRKRISLLLGCLLDFATLFSLFLCFLLVVFKTLF